MTLEIIRTTTLGSCSIKYRNEIILFILRPICLGDSEDIEMKLSDRFGVVAGWGATEIAYGHTLCGYKRGVVHPNSVSSVLKKVDGLRYIDIEIVP